MAARGVVELHRSIGLVGLDRDPPQEVEVGARLDLDDLGAELGEEPSRLRHRDADPEIDDADARERRAGSAGTRRGAWRGASSPVSRAPGAGAGRRSPAGVTEKLNGPGAIGASPTTGKPVRWKKPRVHVCSSSTKSSGRFTGTSGTSRRRPSASTSASVRDASASAAIRRMTSAFTSRKSGISHSGPASASGFPSNSTNARHWRGLPGSTRTQPSATASTW